MEGLKEFLKSVPPGRVLTPAEIASEKDVETALFAMRATGSEFITEARQLAAAFALGPEGEIATIYKRRRKGCSLLEDGVEGLVKWASGDISDGEAAALRKSLSVESVNSESVKWLYSALQAVVGGFAPNPWGGCAFAHACAKTTYAAFHSGVDAMIAKKKSEKYHAFLIGQVL